MTQNSTIGIPKSNIALNGANSNITSMTGLTGTLKAPTAILDTNGNNQVTFTATASAVNYINITNDSAGRGATIKATGSDTDINLILSAKGSFQVRCASPTGTSVLSLRPNFNTNTLLAVFSVPTITASRTYTFTDASGTIQMGSASNGTVAHAGGGQASATVLLSISNNVSTVASPGDSVKLPVVTQIGQPYYIRNSGGGNSMNLYPQSGGQIDSLGTDNPLAIANGTAAIIIPFSSTQFYTFSVA